MSWRMQFFTPPKSSGPAYVKDGLVLWLDGIDNAGVGVHDPNATEWVNLVDGTPFALSGGYAVEPSAVSFRGGAAKGKVSLAGGDRTVEVLFTDYRSAGGYPWATAPTNIPALFFAGTRQVAAVAGPGYEKYTTLPTVQSFLRSDTFRGGDWIFSRDGTHVSTGATGLPLPAYDGDMYIANRANGDRALDASIASVRIYSRALTAEETAANYAVDKERFAI